MTAALCELISRHAGFIVVCTVHGVRQWIRGETWKAWVCCVCDAPIPADGHAYRLNAPLVWPEHNARICVAHLDPGPVTMVPPGAQSWHR